MPNEFLQAVQNGDCETVKQLLNKDSVIINQSYSVSELKDINSFGTEEQTALQIACRNDQPDMVKLLLQNGADPNKMDGDGQVPLYNLLNRKGSPTFSRQLIARLLLSHGTDYSAQLEDSIYYSSPIKLVLELGLTDYYDLFFTAALIRVDEKNAAKLLSKMHDIQSIISAFEGYIEEIVIAKETREKILVLINKLSIGKSSRDALTKILSDHIDAGALPKTLEDASRRLISEKQTRTPDSQVPSEEIICNFLYLSGVIQSRQTRRMLQQDKTEEAKHYLDFMDKNPKLFTPCGVFSILLKQPIESWSYLLLEDKNSGGYEFIDIFCRLYFIELSPADLDALAQEKINYSKVKKFIAKAIQQYENPSEELQQKIFLRQRLLRDVSQVQDYVNENLEGILAKMQQENNEQKMEIEQLKGASKKYEQEIEGLKRKFSRIIEALPALSAMLDDAVESEKKQNSGNAAFWVTNK